MKCEGKSILAYEGHVKIEMRRGETVLKTFVDHNEGTAELFHYIANALAGTTDNSGMPRFLHLFKAADPALDTGNDLYGTSRSACALNVPFSTLEVIYDASLGGYGTSYTFLIPYSQFVGTSANVLALYPTQAFGDGITPLAFLRLTQEDLVYGSDLNYVVTWTLMVRNAAVVE